MGHIPMWDRVTNDDAKESEEDMIEVIDSISSS